MMTDTVELAQPKPARRKAAVKLGTPPTKRGKAGTSVTPTLAAAVRSPPEPTGTKRSAVVALLKRETGASLADLVAATGWLSHTVRAALTGLRKRGMTVSRIKVGDETHYVITGGVA